MHCDSQLSIWKFGTMSQMVERQMTGKDVCVVCTKGLVKVHRVSQDGPPPPNSHVFYLPWPEVTIEQEMIVKKMITRSVFGLNQYNLVKEIQECPKHGDVFRTGDCAVPWCSECRILLRRHSKQKSRSTKFIRTRSTIDTMGISVTARKIPDQINYHTPDLAPDFETLNSGNFPAVTTDVFDIAEISTSTGFHIAVGPALDTSLPSFAGDCPAVHSYHLISMS